MQKHLEPAAFFSRYQILRNITYASGGRRHVVFVFPEQNEKLRGGKRFIETVCREHRELVRCVEIESMIETLSDASTPHLQELREKYLIEPVSTSFLPLAFPYGVDDYRRQLDAWVLASGGGRGPSVVGFLPAFPAVPWTIPLAARLRETGSAVRFLSYLFSDLVLAGSRASRPITIDGFLGSAGHTQSPWILLPAIGAWVRSTGSKRGALEHLRDALAAWHREGRESPAHIPDRLSVADELRPFVPHGRIRNEAIAQSYVDQALQLMRPAVSESASHISHR